jgi:hypothetical protein
MIYNRQTNERVNIVCYLCLGNQTLFILRTKQIAQINTVLSEGAVSIVVATR